MTKKQSGFAHLAIVTVVLAVVVVGLLGYVFWQNFMQPKASTLNASNTSNTTPKTDKNETVPEVVLDSEIVAQTTVKFAMNYPSSWTKTYTQGSESSGVQESFKLTSPSGNISVYFQVGLSGVGGTCDTQDMNYVIEQGEYDTVPKFASVQYIEAITHVRQQDVYYFAAGLRTASTVTPIKAGDQACSVGMFLFQYAGLTNGASIILNNVKSGQHSTLAEATAALNSDEYATARRILISLHIN